MDRFKEEIVVNEVSINAFDNTEDKSVIVISWAANIGWGQYTLIEQEDGSWTGDSEFMDDNDDKDFLKMLFDKFIEGVTVKND